MGSGDSGRDAAVYPGRSGAIGAGAGCYLRASAKWHRGVTCRGAGLVYKGIMSTSPTPPSPHLPRDDLDAALAARRELGPDYDEAFAETVASRIREVLEGGRTKPMTPAPATAEVAKAEREAGLAVAIVSLIASVPLTAIAANVVGLPGLLTVWIGLTMINVAYALRRR